MPAERNRQNGVLHKTDGQKLKPKLHLLGMKRSGKSSILRTVFHRENASDTLYLESTKEVCKEPKSSIIDFEVWDFPSTIDDHDLASSPRTMLSAPGSLIWVIDAQDEYYQAIDVLAQVFRDFAEIATGKSGSKATNLRLPSHINVEIFIHKIDGVSSDFRSEIYRDIESRINEELDAYGLESVRSACSYHHTSIYDHSIFEAISKVVQRHIRPHFHATIEALVNSLCSNCRIEKAYLFDSQYMFYIASDTKPGDPKAYETLCDYLDVVRDITQVYGWRDRDPNEEEVYDETHMESMVVMEKRGSRYLYVKAMNKYLTLACVMGEDNPAEKHAIIEYNVRIFQDGLNQILDKLG